MKKNTIFAENLIIVYMENVTKKETSKSNEVSKLSKAGMWLKENPNGVFVIKDLRAVML